jgi:hypothetical protein
LLLPPTMERMAWSFEKARDERWNRSVLDINSGLPSSILRAHQLEGHIFAAVSALTGMSCAQRRYFCGDDSGERHSLARSVPIPRDLPMSAESYSLPPTMERPGRSFGNRLVRRRIRFSSETYCLAAVVRTQQSSPISKAMCSSPRMTALTERSYGRATATARRLGPLWSRTFEPGRRARIQGNC